MSMSTVSELNKMSIAKLRSRLQRIEMVLPNIPMFGAVRPRGPAAVGVLYTKLPCTGRRAALSRWDATPGLNQKMFRPLTPAGSAVAYQRPLLRCAAR